MEQNDTGVRAIAWTQAFPFVRLFGTLRLALNFNRLMLALLCVLACYIVGAWLLDSLWEAGGGGVVRRLQGAELATEIEAYARHDQVRFEAWVAQARIEREQVAVEALTRGTGLATTVEEAREKLAEGPGALSRLLRGGDFRADRSWAESLITERLAKGLETIAGDRRMSAAGREAAREKLIRAADELRIILSERGRSDVGIGQYATPLMTIVGADTSVAAPQQTKDRERLELALARAAALRKDQRLAGDGPFFELAKYEARCFAAAIQGVASGRLGFSGGALDDQPAMAGSVASAWRGIAWLLTQRPGYMAVYGLCHLLIFAFFGGAICRSAAVQAARDEGIGLRESLAFACEKYVGLVTAPLIPILVVACIAVVMFFGGIIGLFPYLGQLLTGLLYVLGLLGGFVAAMFVLATVLAFHLMWPTIATEGSDGFDALSRSYSYVGTRIWHVGFYSLVLLAFGALSYVLVRLVVLLTLKLSHAFTGLGMNTWSSAKLDSVPALDVMWTMPAWADLTLLPDPHGPPLVGYVFNGPLSWAEAAGAGLMSIWLFLFVGLLAAFAVSFFFCGSTQMYFLLRRDVDATDWEEVYYEEPDEEELTPPAGPETTGPMESSEPPEPSTAVEAVGGDAPDEVEGDPSRGESTGGA